MKRDFLQIYHQQASNLNDSNQNVHFLLAENSKSHQIGNAYLQNEMTIKKVVVVAASRVLVNGNAIRLVNKAFAHCFKGIRISTTGSSYIQHNKFVGQISFVMRVLKHNDGDLLSHCDEIDESEAEIENTSLHHHLINNHDIAANKKNSKVISPLDIFLDFVKDFEKLLNS